MTDASFHAFLNRFRSGAASVSSSWGLTESLRVHVHPLLLQFWTDVGFGSFGNGFLRILPPEELESALMTWLQKPEPDPSRVPFAVTAFGDLIYWRRLLDPRKEGCSWDEAGDLCFLSVNHGSTPKVICHTPGEFFGGALVEFLEQTPEALYVFYEDLQAWQRVGGSLAKAGEDQCYGFRQLPRLDGAVDLRNLELRNLRTYAQECAEAVRTDEAIPAVIDVAQIGHPVEEVFATPLCGADLGIWSREIGPKTQILARSMFGDLFTFDPTTGTGHLLRPADGIHTAFGEYDSPQAFLNEALRRKDVVRVILRPEAVRDLSQNLGSLQNGEVWFPMPFPFLGGKRDNLDCYQNGTLQDLLEMTGQAQGLG